MSAFTEYAARSERPTSVLRHESADLLSMFDPLAPGEGFPISGDMIATMTRDTRSRVIGRRMIFRSLEAGAEL